MLRKARKHKSGVYETILERWNEDGKYRTSLSDIGWTEEEIIQYDAIELEDHSYVATWQEKSRNGKSWNISLNAKGMQGPLNQRRDLKEEKQKCKRLLDEHTAITGDGNKPISPAQQVRQRLDQQFEGFEEYDYRLELRTGWRFYPSSRTTHSSSSGNKAAPGSQIEAGIRGKHHPGLNSNFFFVQRCHIACRKFNPLAIDGVCRQTDLPRTTFSHAQLLHRLFSVVVRVYSPTLTSMHLHGSSHEAHCLRVAQKHSHLILVAQSRTPC